MRTFDIGVAVRRCIPLIGSNTPTDVRRVHERLQASFDLGSSFALVPSDLQLSNLPSNQITRLVSSTEGIKAAKAAGASSICVRCPSNDLLARLGHKEGAAYSFSAEALFVTAEAPRGPRKYATLMEAVRRTSDMIECAHDLSLGTVLLLDSALGCRYKSTVEVSELIDLTNRFLEDGQTQHVIWEEGPRGGTVTDKARPLFPSIFIPRVAENLAKTAVASGIDMSKVSFMLRDNDFITTEIMRKLSALGTRSYAASSARVWTDLKGSDLPATYATFSQILSVVAEDFGQECPDELLDAVEMYLELEGSA
eukprot:GILI01032727.1.p1 GENE.GILI01032727.1~~GILI01032727.1.p1  ORF type:complete len:327 (-),score=4.71 GILI01032727.1:225-1154(-)